MRVQNKENCLTPSSRTEDEWKPSRWRRTPPLKFHYLYFTRIVLQLKAKIVFPHEFKRSSFFFSPPSIGFISKVFCLFVCLLWGKQKRLKYGLIVNVCFLSVFPPWNLSALHACLDCVTVHLNVCWVGGLCFVQLSLSLASGCFKFCSEN